MGISLGVKSGLVFALISGEDTPLVDLYAKKMDIKDVYKGCKDKASALRSFAREHNLELAQVCFMGDDINDASALELAGFAAVPATAHESARSKADFVTKSAGGLGAVREVLDLIISNNRGEAS